MQILTKAGIEVGKQVAKELKKKAGAKAAKAAKVAKAAKEKKAVDKYRKREAIERAGTMADGERGPMTLSNKKAILRDLKKKDKARNAIVDNPVMKAIQKVPNKYPRTTAGTIVGGGGVLKKRKENETRDKKDKKKMKKGGIVKSHRGDGIAKRGRTRGRIV
jgi:hypothetical protein